MIYEKYIPGHLNDQICISKYIFLIGISSSSVVSESQLLKTLAFPVIMIFYYVNEATLGKPLGSLKMGSRELVARRTSLGSIGMELSVPPQNFPS